MSMNITVEELKTILQEANKPMMESIAKVDSRVFGVEIQIASARAEISEQVTKNAVIESDLGNHKREQEKEIAKIHDSQSKNWDMTRDAHSLAKKAIDITGILDEKIGKNSIIKNWISFSSAGITIITLLIVIYNSFKS